MNAHEERLWTMLADGTTWDLNKYDRAAIRWALDEIEQLRKVARRAAWNGVGGPSDRLA